MGAKVGPIPAPLLVAAVLAVAVWLYLRHRASTQATSAGSNATPGVNSGYPQGSDSAGGGSTGGSGSGVVATPAGPVFSEPGRPGTITDDAAVNFGARPGVPEPPPPVARPGIIGAPGYSYDAPMRPAIPDQSSERGFVMYPVLPYGGNTAPAFVASQPTRPGSTFADGTPEPRAAVPEPPAPSERQTVPLPPPRPSGRV